MWTFSPNSNQMPRKQNTRAQHTQTLICNKTIHSNQKWKFIFQFVIRSGLLFFFCLSMQIYIFSLEACKFTFFSFENRFLCVFLIVDEKKAYHKILKNKIGKNRTTINHSNVNFCILNHSWQINPRNMYVPIVPGIKTHAHTLANQFKIIRNANIIRL